jgi:hypothetical protein
MDMLNVLSGWETDWSHHFSLPSVAAGHRSETLTVMVFPNGGWLLGEYGSRVGVILKQRPQASPKPLWAPNAKVLTAAVYPYVTMPHATEGRRAQHGLRDALIHENRRGAYRAGGSVHTP